MANTSNTLNISPNITMNINLNSNFIVTLNENVASQVDLTGVR